MTYSTTMWNAYKRRESACHTARPKFTCHKLLVVSAHSLSSPAFKQYIHTISSITLLVHSRATFLYTQYKQSL